MVGFVCLHHSACYSLCTILLVKLLHCENKAVVFAIVNAKDLELLRMFVRCIQLLFTNSLTRHPSRT